MQELKANTAVDVLIGPFMDEDDGKTTEEALTILQANVKLSKLGQALTQKTESSNSVHDADGYYNCVLDTTDTASEGTLTLTCHMTGALPVRHEYMVLSEAAWDSKYAAKDTGFMSVNVDTIKTQTVTCGAGVTVNPSVGAATIQPTNAQFEARSLASADYVVVGDTIAGATLVGSVSGDTKQTADVADLITTVGVAGAGLTDVTLGNNAHGGAASTLTLSDYSDFTGAGSGLTALASGTAQSGTASTIVLAASAAFANDELNGNVINIHTGTGAGQSRVILSNTLADDTCNVSPNWTTNPDATSQYEIVQGSTNTAAVSLTAQTANDNGADINTILVDTADMQPRVVAIEVDTTEIGAAGAGLTAINLPNQTMDITGDITGNLSGSVGSVTGAVGSVTGSVGSVAGNVDGLVTGTVAGKTPAEAGDLMGLANDAITSAKYDESTAHPTTTAMQKAGSVIITGTVHNAVAPTTTEFEADDITTAAADHYNGRIVIFTSGTLLGQATDITDYALNGGIGHFTVTALTSAPANDATFVIV